MTTLIIALYHLGSTWPALVSHVRHLLHLGALLIGYIINSHYRYNA